MGSILLAFKVNWMRVSDEDLYHVTLIESWNEISHWIIKESYIYLFEIEDLEFWFRVTCKLM